MLLLLSSSLLLISSSPYVSRDSSFISTQLLVENLDGRLGVSSNKFIIFDIPLLYYCYINLKK